MNRSGEAALALCRHYDVEPAAMVVVYDDADLELGRLRLRLGGGSGGHNGLRSLTESLGASEFQRLRLGVMGVDRRGQELAEYVLEPFTGKEEEIVEEQIGRAADALSRALDDGFVTAMNEFNRRSQPADDGRPGSESDDG